MASITCKLGGETHTHTSAVEVASCALAWDTVNGEVLHQVTGALREAVERRDRDEAEMDALLGDPDAAYERYLETRDWMEQEAFADYERRAGLIY